MIRFNDHTILNNLNSNVVCVSNFLVGGGAITKLHKCIKIAKIIFKYLFRYYFYTLHFMIVQFESKWEELSIFFTELLQQSSFRRAWWSSFGLLQTSIGFKQEIIVDKAIDGNRVNIILRVINIFITFFIRLIVIIILVFS